MNDHELRRHPEGLINGIAQPLTNALAEGLNRLIAFFETHGPGPEGIRQLPQQSPLSPR